MHLAKAEGLLALGLNSVIPLLDEGFRCMR